MYQEAPQKLLVINSGCGTATVASVDDSTGVSCSGVVAGVDDSTGFSCSGVVAGVSGTGLITTSGVGGGVGDGVDCTTLFDEGCTSLSLAGVE